mmetsp:Transcript_25888/g.53856  ORF Transcript_25888/g.53856 Transcript_25888/m.53856 type:complete len:208 (-) Transcript_25888:668-1291(-)
MDLGVYELPHFCDGSVWPRQDLNPDAMPVNLVCGITVHVTLLVVRPYVNGGGIVLVLAYECRVVVFVLAIFGGVVVSAVDHFVDVHLDAILPVFGQKQVPSGLSSVLPDEYVHHHSLDRKHRYVVHHPTELFKVSGTRRPEVHLHGLSSSLAKRVKRNIEVGYHSHVLHIALVEVPVEVNLGPLFHDDHVVVKGPPVILADRRKIGL